MDRHLLSSHGPVCHSKPSACWCRTGAHPLTCLPAYQLHTAFPPLPPAPPATTTPTHLHVVWAVRSCCQCLCQQVQHLGLQLLPTASIIRRDVQRPARTPASATACVPGLGMGGCRSPPWACECMKGGRGNMREGWQSYDHNGLCRLACCGVISACCVQSTTPHLPCSCKGGAAPHQLPLC